MSEVLRRRAVRVLVVEPGGTVLMIHGFDPHDPGTTYWYTIGGGVDPGEPDLEAAVREVWEETGLRVDPARLVGPVHADDVVFPFEGRTVVQQQVYYLLRVPRYAAQPVAFEETEVRSTLEVAWVDPQERQRRGETVYPEGLVELLGRDTGTASESTTSAPTSQNWL
ncbi:MAG TPA: NUDIX domain-containing protein [Pedococcus sp.]|nr:NUDIX domain-containing protein [Pedococcus sp.]